MDFITYAQLRAMFIGAYESVRQNKEKINRINMFPVPDQDTGSNLSKTLEGVYLSLRRRPAENPPVLKQAILDGCMLSAAGNIGVIYLSFVSGFLSALNDEQITAGDLGVAFSRGAAKARQSIQHPREGTVLDAIDAAAAAFRPAIHQEKTMVAILKKTHYEIRQAVNATQHKMAIYREAQVVDAGALGFAISVAGFIDGLEKKQRRVKDISSPAKPSKRFIQILSNRYEVMALIKSPQLTKSEVTAKIGPLGDCLDIVYVDQKAKIHIHTDLPDEVVALLKPIGEVVQMTVTDMAAEVGESKRLRSIGLVIDEAADLPGAVIAKNRIAVVPFTVFQDKKKITDRSALYTQMRRWASCSRKVDLRTSQPPPGRFLAAFRRQLARFDRVICITISSFLSGTYNSAWQARQLLGENERTRVTVVDSLCGTGAEGLLVLKAIRMIQQQSTAGQIFEELKQDRAKVQVFGIPETLDWFVKGGRLAAKPARAMSGLMKLGIKPIIGLKNYKIGLVGMRFDPRRAADVLATEFFSRVSRIQPGNRKVAVMVNHADNAAAARRLKQKIRQSKRLRIEWAGLTEIACVLGVHAGPGTIFCSFLAE